MLSHCVLPKTSFCRRTSDGSEDGMLAQSYEAEQLFSCMVSSATGLGGHMLPI